MSNRKLGVFVGIVHTSWRIGRIRNKPGVKHVFAFRLSINWVLP